MNSVELTCVETIKANLMYIVRKMTLSMLSFFEFARFICDLYIIQVFLFQVLASHDFILTLYIKTIIMVVHLNCNEFNSA